MLKQVLPAFFINLLAGGSLDNNNFIYEIKI